MNITRWIFIFSLISAPALGDQPTCPKGRLPIQDPNVRAIRLYQLTTLAKNDPKKVAELEQATGLTASEVAECIKAHKNKQSQAEKELERRVKKEKPEN